MKQGGDALTFTRLARDGQGEAVERVLADEVPVAIEFNGIGYAVLMATPTDLTDLVLGFALAERLIGPDDAPFDVDTHDTDQGIVARATLPPSRTDLLLDRVRHRASDSSCGLCGIENLEQAIRPLPPVTARSRADRAAIFRLMGWRRINRSMPRPARPMPPPVPTRTGRSVWRGRMSGGTMRSTS